MEEINQEEPKEIILSGRKRDTTAAERTVADAFKKQLLFAGEPTPIQCEGFVSTWQKAPCQTWVHVGYEPFDGSAILLPIAGPGRSLRAILAAIKKAGKHDTRAGAKEVFEALTESSLLKVLRVFNFVIFTDAAGSWQRIDGGVKCIALVAEQLQATGRIGKTPLNILVRKFTQNLFDYGENISLDGFRKSKVEGKELVKHQDIEGQLRHEHNVKTDNIYDLQDWCELRRQTHLQGLRGPLGEDEFAEAMKILKRKKRKKKRNSEEAAGV